MSNKLIQINSKLTKSRQPSEYGINICNLCGQIVHCLDDGYCLISILIHRDTPITIKLGEKYRGQPLEWYLHINDFKYV